MKNSNITILTPYFPTENNPYGGIFVYDQIKIIAMKVNTVDVYVTRPWFKLSRKFPFITSGCDDLALKNIGENNVSIKLIRYLPFPKDSILYHLSLSISLFINKHKFSNNLLVHTVYPLGAAVHRLKLFSTTVIHGSDFRYFSDNIKQYRAIESVINNSCIVCVSKGLMAEIINSEGVINNKADISVIENGVSIADVKKSPEEKRLDSDTFKFIFVGSLIKLKGVHELLEAFALLQQINGQGKYSLTFVGDGAEQKYLEEKVIKNNITNVRFAGSVENKEVMRTLAEHDCLILPSYQEGFGRVIIEMLSLGKPVIATKSGGPEFILNKQTGIIVPPKDIKALSSAMSKIHTDFNLYSSLSIKEYVKQNYCLEMQTLKLLTVVFKGRDSLHKT